MMKDVREQWSEPMTLLQIDFPSAGPWGDDLTKKASDLAHLLNTTPGMVWKIWTENSRTGDCGGVYLFNDESSANNFLKEHLPRLDSLGFKNVRAKVLDVNEGLSHITRAPIAMAVAKTA
jgi:Putative mono-oxygenase ydhR